MSNKIITIIGPTASGKTGLAVKLALKHQGEVISADSRQVYKGMDIGTGKDLAEYRIKQKNGRYKDIPYHLIDVVSPNTDFSLAKFYKLAFRSMDDVLIRNKLPIIAGGTGLYAQAVVDGYELSSVKADYVYRDKLEKLSVEKLYVKLKKIDYKFAEQLHESDQKNRRRLARYIEIKTQESKLRDKKNFSKKLNKNYNFLILGITWPREILCERIYKRLIVRLEKEKMIDEVERLHFENKVAWKRLENFGLEYRYISYFLKGEMSYDEMIEKLNIAIRQFAKRQMSWYRRWEKQGTKIHWIKNFSEADKLTRDFLR